MLKFALPILVFMLPAAAHAEMTVGTFLTKADALKAKGILAITSPDINLLKQEMGVVTKGYREEIIAARAAGRTPHSCPPPKSRMHSDALMGHFRSLPANTGLKAGFYSLMKAKYPCPAK